MGTKQVFFNYLQSKALYVNIKQANTRFKQFLLFITKTFQNTYLMCIIFGLKNTGAFLKILSYVHVLTSQLRVLLLHQWRIFCLIDAPADMPTDVFWTLKLRTPGVLQQAKTACIHPVDKYRHTTHENHSNTQWTQTK